VSVAVLWVRPMRRNKGLSRSVETSEEVLVASGAFSQVFELAEVFATSRSCSVSSPLPQPDTSHAMLRVGGVVDVASNKRRAAGKLGSVLIRRYQQQHAGRAACGLQNTVPVICRRASGFQAAQAGPVCERWHHHGVSAAAVPAQEFARRIALPTLAARPLFGRASLNNGIISCQRRSACRALHACSQYHTS
jgi:hypothetical protein